MHFKGDEVHCRLFDCAAKECDEEKNIIVWHVNVRNKAKKNDCHRIVLLGQCRCLNIQIIPDDKPERLMGQRHNVFANQNIVYE